MEAAMEIEMFEACMSLQSGHDLRVNDDMMRGSTVGVRGTPTSLINGETVSGAVPIDMLRSVIDVHLNDEKTSPLTIR